MDDFDQRRAWLDELLALPHLWPGQVETVRALAAELGVQVHVWRCELTMDAVWQKERHD